MIFLFFCVFKFFSNEHRMTFIIFKTCFLETKTQCDSAMTRLPGKLVPSLAALEKYPGPEGRPAVFGTGQTLSRSAFCLALSIGNHGDLKCQGGTKMW